MLALRQRAAPHAMVVYDSMELVVTDRAVAAAAATSSWVPGELRRGVERRNLLRVPQGSLSRIGEDNGGMREGVDEKSAHVGCPRNCCRHRNGGARSQPRSQRMALAVLKATWPVRGKDSINGFCLVIEEENSLGNCFGLVGIN